MKDRKEGLMERLASTLALPGDAFAGLPRLELVGDRELRLEQFGSILSCTTEELHVEAGHFVLLIRGTSLSIRAMRERELLVTGQFQSLELI